MLKKVCAALWLAMCLAPLAFAEDNIHATLWARATPPGSTSGAIYGAIKNDSDTEISLQRVEFTGARHVMVHRTLEEAGVMRMRHAAISIAPNATAVLQPGGLHIMLMGLVEPFKQGCSETVVLHWSHDDQTVHQVRVGGYGQQTDPGAAPNKKEDKNADKTSNLCN